MTAWFYKIAPTPAPRQVRKDIYKPSPSVQRYRAFRDDVWRKKVRLPAGFFHVVFLIAMPPSWAADKRTDHLGRPHLHKPDKDNLEKALVDAVYRNSNDAHVWHSASTKLWAAGSGIIISDEWLPFDELPIDFGSIIVQA